MNALDKEGGSPLFHAILQRKQAVAELLLKYGADPNQAEASLDGYRGVSPLMTAVRHPGTYTDSKGVLRQVGPHNHKLTYIPVFVLLWYNVINVIASLSM